MAFTGVVLGLIFSGNPLSVYTLYGIIALAGMSVNAAIVLISAANSRLREGVSVMRATLYAARRRVMPILITTLTTMAGLFALAAGVGGESLMWGPVATAIVWGLGFSAALTLFVVPLLYARFVRSPAAQGVVLPLPSAQLAAAGSLLARGGLQLKRWLSRSAGVEFGERFPAGSEVRVSFNDGVRHLWEGNFEAAIKELEATAERVPEDEECSLYAAQALIGYMQKNGWDVGYYARAKRYLTRARRLDPSDGRVPRLQQALAGVKKPRQAESFPK